VGLGFGKGLCYTMKINWYILENWNVNNGWFSVGASRNMKIVSENLKKEIYNCTQNNMVLWHYAKFALRFIKARMIKNIPFVFYIFKAKMIKRKVFV